MTETDKNYYIEPRLKDKLDYFAMRQKKKFDHLILLGGNEGIGKTTCAVHIGYYFAWKTGKQFTVDNIFFDVDDLMKFAAETERQVIMWDEATLGAMSMQWQSKVQQKLVQCLMMARKKGHLWLFCIPYLEELKPYFIKRAAGVLYVYARKDVQRGRYVYFNNKAKKDLLIQKQKRVAYMSYKKYSFRGTFNDVIGTHKVIDEDAYENKKDDAILKVFSGQNPDNAWKERFDKLKINVGSLSILLNETYGVTIRDIAKSSDMSKSFVHSCIELARKHNNYLKIRGFVPVQSPE